MSQKTLLFVLALITLSCVIEARSFLKKFHEKELASQARFKQTGERALDTLSRKRRDAEESTSVSDEEAASLVKFFMTVAWQEDKLDILAEFLNDFGDSDTNLTVIGWQRILDDKGAVKEINTVQLIIPPKPEEEYNVNVVDDDDDDDDDYDDDKILPHKMIQEMKEVFEPMASIGIPASVTMEEFNKENELETLIYLDKDELYVKAEGFAIYNKTAIASQEEVDNFIKSLKPSIVGEPSVLKYDVDGNLIVDQSKIHPFLLGCVLDHYEAPDNVLLASPQIIAEVSSQYSKEQIPKQLAIRYNKAFPEYTWRVLVDPENHYITRDVSVTLSYDNVDLDETSDISYLVVGVKKSNATTK